MSKKKPKIRTKRGGKESKRAKRRQLDLIALGGVNEIGKNMFALETDDELLVIDCGMSFPGEEHLGVDYLIPDFNYLLKKRKKIVGIILTHGHEDHIGAIPFLPEQIEVPVYGTPITVAFAESKLGDFGRVGEIEFYEFKAGEVFDVGSDFEVEPYHVNHSMPDGVGFAIRTKAGLYVHSGDFKIDQTPVDNWSTDFARLSALGEEGVDFLTIDVTNVDRAGYTASERHVGRGIRQILDRYPEQRIFAAMFSSNVHRVQQAIDTAYHFGRVTALMGRSMIQSVHIALELGYLKVPGDALIDGDKINSYPDNKVMILATGSQGEPMSALRRMSRGLHKVSIHEGDVVIISASPIPGNEAAVWHTINDLCRLGARVIYQAGEVHVSGHASREEIKMVCNLLKPRWVMPFHGELRHVAQFKELVEDMALDDDAFIRPELGRRMSIGPRKVKYGERVQSGTHLVDGLFVEEEGSELLKERQELSQGGVLVVNVLVDAKSKKFKSVNVTSRGFITPTDDDFIGRITQVLLDSLKATRETDFVDFPAYKGKVDEKMAKYLWKNTNRRPSVLTNIIEI